jgi:hypothetical protein
MRWRRFTSKENVFRFLNRPGKGELMTAPEIHPDDELLVAYLDDQLPRKDRQSVEQRLTSDLILRQRLVGLQRSWDALEELPLPTLDSARMATTISLVAMAAERDMPAPQPGSWSNWVPLARQLAIVATGLLVGFLCLAIPQRWRYLANLRDLPIALRMHEYQAAQNLESGSGAILPGRGFLGPDSGESR